jgi:hypothetical protein
MTTTTGKTLSMLNKDREALSGLHARLNDMTQREYNALVHAIWNIDRLIRELNEGEE